MVTIRSPEALVIRPKLVEPVFAFGLPHCGLFRALIVSARSVKLVVSPIRRARLASRYNLRIEESPGRFVLPMASLEPGREPSYHIYPVVFRNREERDRMEEDLKARGVQSSIHYRPVHRMTAFRRLLPEVSLPRTEAYGERELTLPLYPSMDPAQVDMIVDSMVHSYSQA